MYMPPRLWDCQEPPKCVVKAMLEADVIFTPVSISIAWTKAMTEALQNGACALLMTAFTDNIFTSEALLNTDFEEQREVCNKLALKYAEAQFVHLTTELGTDLKFQIGGKK